MTRLSPKAKKRRHLYWKSKPLLLVGAMYCETWAFYNLLFFLLTVDSVACKQQTQFRSSLLSLRKKSMRTRAGKRFPWRKTFLAINDLALKIKELTRETSRKMVRGGYVYKSKLKGRRSLCIAALFSQIDASTKVHLPGSWEWLMK